MAARSGMVSLIDRLRGMTAAGTADWSLGTATFWDDDHMQEVLDEYRTDFYRAELVPVPVTVSGASAAGGPGTAVYRRYDVPYQNLETIASGTPIFDLSYSFGGTVTEAGTIDYMKGVITFNNDQRGTAFFLSGRSYDVNAAAADVWRKKAAHYAEAYDIKTGDKDLKRSDLIKHCLEMAERFDVQAGAFSIGAERSDTL